MPGKVRFGPRRERKSMYEGGASPEIWKKLSKETKEADIQYILDFQEKTKYTRKELEKKNLTRLEEIRRQI